MKTLKIEMEQNKTDEEKKTPEKRDSSSDSSQVVRQPALQVDDPITPTRDDSPRYRSSVTLRDKQLGNFLR